MNNKEFKKMAEKVLIKRNQIFDKQILKTLCDQSYMPSNNGGIKNLQPITKVSLCKQCLKTKRYATTSLCYGCWKTHEREKRAKKKEAALLRKVKSKKYQQDEWKKWHNKAWKVFSEYIRRRGADWRGNVTCITCSKQFHWKDLHAGHFKHGKLDFDPMNINPQCAADNTYKGGKLDVYALKLIDMYGLEAVKELEQRANTKIYTLDELKNIFTKYQELIKTLN